MNPTWYRSLRALLFALLLVGLPAAAEQRPLRLGIMPFNSALALIKTHQPLRLHLQNALGRPVEIFTSADYVTFLNESLAGHFDLMITGPHFGVMGIEKGALPLVRYQARLQPVFVVRPDSGIRGFSDLKGKRIGLSSRLSISSIGGVKWLLDQGLVMGRDFQLYERATHGAAVASVAVGELDAALTTHTPLKQIPEDVRSRVTVLPLDVQVPHLMTLANPRLGNVEVARIRDALWSFGDTPEGQEFFRETGYGGYAEVQRTDIDALRAYVDLTRRVMGLKQ